MMLVRLFVAFVVIGITAQYWALSLIIVGCFALVYVLIKLVNPDAFPESPVKAMMRKFLGIAPKPESKSSRTGMATADLTRRRTPYRADENVFTAVDIETTGVDSDIDRIVEIGLVKFTADGTVLDEFATLVNNPGSSDRARQVHGVEDTDLVDAPYTGDVLGEVFAFMNGTVLVAHNFAFENGFLAAAAEHAGLALPDVLGVCTLATSRRQLDGRAYSLTVMYKTATGQFPEHKHTALGDARACRAVLLWLLDEAPEPLHLSDRPPALTSSYVDAAPCQINYRPVDSSKQTVADMLAAFPQSPYPRAGDPGEIEKYRVLLAETVENQHLTFDEAETLARQARRTRLTGSQLSMLYRQAWDTAFPKDKDIPWAELEPVRRREMYRLADALGLVSLASEIRQAIDACAEPAPSEESRYLRTLRIGIAGDDNDVVLLRKRAEEYGAKLAVNITKTVQWLATTTPDAVDAKHNSARKLAISMITPAEASARLEAAIQQATTEAEMRKYEAAVRAAERQTYLEEREAYWRPTWRAIELDHDPEGTLRYN